MRPQERRDTIRAANTAHPEAVMPLDRAAATLAGQQVTAAHQQVQQPPPMAYRAHPADQVAQVAQVTQVAAYHQRAAHQQAAQ